MEAFLDLEQSGAWFDSLLYLDGFCEEWTAEGLCGGRREETCGIGPSQCPLRRESGKTQ